MMETRYAKVEHGVVVHVCIAVSDNAAPGRVRIPDDQPEIGEGDLYDGVVFSKPAPPPPTPEEAARAVEHAAIADLRAEAKAMAMFATLRSATLEQISNWVDTEFPALNGTQRMFLKLLAANASMYLRERP